MSHSQGDCSYERNVCGEGTPFELELDKEDLHELLRPRRINIATPDPAQRSARLPTRVAASQQAHTGSTHSVVAARSFHVPTPGVAVALGLALAAVLVGGVRPWSAGRPMDEAIASLPGTAAPVAPLPSAPSIERAAVRFVNPFDHTEVFEFPPGTSKAEAREKVADLLLKRARERQTQHQRIAAVR